MNRAPSGAGQKASMKMTKVYVGAAAIVVLALSPAHAQRRGTGTTGTSGGGAVTFAVAVTDASGAPIDDAKVTVTGTAERTGRTEDGRLVFENLRPGTYRFRFDKDGYVSLERELTARAGAPVDVKVALTAAPPPPKPIEPVKPPPPPSVAARPMGLDLPTYIKDNYVGRAPGKASGLSCTTGGAANLLQINDPIRQHTHGDSDEFIYVIAGEGNAQIGGAAEPMSAGMFLVVPRGMAHSFTASKKPLVVLSILAGDKCAA
jgi:mannose-6-phosphate isomerase-like protein (cupin superfamily)